MHRGALVSSMPFEERETATLNGAQPFTTKQKTRHRIGVSGRGDGKRRNMVAGYTETGSAENHRQPLPSSSSFCQLPPNVWREVLENAQWYKGTW
jgi:hypothetical protein